MSTTVTRVLKNGSKVPWIGFGTGTALYNRDAEKDVLRAIDAGFIHLDGAQAYGNEDSLGKAIANAKVPRESLWVTTKLGALNGQTVEESLKGSLQRLGLDYVDLWLIHTPTGLEDKLKDVWKQFIEVRNKGLAKNIGVSNFRIKDLEKILEGGDTEIPQLNQIELHPYVLKATQPLLDFQNKHGIKTESYGGLIPVSTKTDGPLAPVLKEITSEVAKRHGSPVTEAQVLLKWLEARDIIIVTTSSKESRLKEYLDALNVPQLTPEEVSAIDAAGSKLHFRKFGQHMDS
ncbi:hypothetical protein M422DRAFT_261943 [Sphaerobolus stellatus SS14]|uniref:NADP-dependent oxidoreductase domain-containing protein n=1 Tax=Sphaerobolus stellatus (strain SS14) TaxID=990650 RepID=A0A0C9V281_SPHS4|nr:hypothetical protein M422DRAFT_261943 [Sphaerobolus stellatus SS14]